jgi:hypothetical protein
MAWICSGFGNEVIPLKFTLMFRAAALVAYGIDAPLIASPCMAEVPAAAQSDA